MKKNLPIFDIILNDDDIKHGVGMISLVDSPAIGVNWIKLAKQEVENTETYMSLTDKGLCFGCPPNGDGMTVKGKPDGRCKDSSKTKETPAKKPKKKQEPKAPAKDPSLKAKMDKADDISGVTSERSTWYKGVNALFPDDIKDSRGKPDTSDETYKNRTDWINRRAKALKAAGKGQWDKSIPDGWERGGPGSKAWEPWKDNIAPWDRD